MATMTRTGIRRTATDEALAGLSDPTAPRDRWHLPSTLAFWLQTSIAVLLLAGSSAPTPLYAIYQARWHFSPITVTVVFGIYAIAVLAALLTAGSLSDHVGRRPVLLTALALQVVTMVVFTTASSVGELVVARVIQGLSTGAALGAIGAGLLDIDRVKGTVANAVGPMTGTATGALVSALFIAYLPSPTHLIYLALLAAFVVQGVGVALMAETATPKPGALRSLRPQIALPPAARRPFLAATPALVAVWTIAGFYGSVGPSLLHVVAGSSWIVLGGLALFALAGSGAVTVVVLDKVPPRTLMAVGSSALIVGIGITLLAIHALSIGLFFVGAVIAGAGFGAAFQGGLRSVVPFAEVHERAGVISAIFVVSYLSLGLPAVIGGWFVVHGGGLIETSYEYGAAVMGLAGIALLALLAGRRGSRGLNDGDQR